ncbi:hypothetical protein [Nocardioides jiangxiensis]|uniref:Uncharacterized protein n=1 Tax=Nocardioides jiangxiensis TaxID=3064524 RepID=A0ABT9B3J3_9ACTN|nr:hypothetical protein [Nocardioides sp. WY-20]MDO7869412.1 hypothetical protein [Nocardioides sp. WY-20]
MTTVLALLVLIAGFGLLVHLARNDRFAGPAPLDRFRDSDGFLVSEVTRLFPR